MEKEVLYSFTIPVYNEEESLKELYSEIVETCKKHDILFELVFVNDGSTDNSLKILQEIKSSSNYDIKIVNFIKNFGRACALQAGFDYTKGDYVFTMDSDLQDDPKEIPNFIEEMEKQNVDVISGWKFNRLDPLSKKIPSKIANFFTRLLSGTKIHDMGCGFKLYKKKALNDLNIHGDMHRFILTILSSKGYKVGELKINHRKRKYGKTKFGFGRIITSSFDFLTIALITKYLQKPLHFFGKIGLSALMISGLVLVYLFITWLYGNSIGTRPLFIFSLMMFILSIQIILFGLVAELTVRNKEKKHYIEVDIDE